MGKQVIVLFTFRVSIWTAYLKFGLTVAGAASVIATAAYFVVSSLREEIFISTASVIRCCLLAVDYSRKGDQPAVAPAALKGVSKTAGGVSIATLDGRSVPGDNFCRIVRELELRGNTFESTLTREHLIVTSTFLRDDLVDVVPLLVNQVFNPSFQPYEFLEAQPFVVSESAAALSDSTTEVIDKLHQVAFRTGLGNSLFANPASVGGLKRAHLQDFAGSYFTSDRVALVGTGVAHDEVSELLEASLKAVSLSSAKPSIAGSKYFGGEARIEAGAKSTATYAVAFNSIPFTSPQYAASLVLAAILDGSRRLKWGSTGASGLLAAATSADASVSAFSAAYTDAGLFGFVVKGSTGSIKDAAQKSIDAVKSVASGVSSAVLEKAKKAAHVLATGNYANITELAAAISKVSADEVASLAKNVLSSKPSVVARGNLLKLPYADELKF
ncbi:Metalloenzyme, LuxS/M16 peptidase-like protein [Chytridium lagenaria]|nr:Metalloenzyme, LuxS/M16 peptidase-like protein [Chytridium lagenaria]